MAQPPSQGPTSMDYSIDALTESMSRMLVRGDRYGMDTNIRSIILEETWAWPPDCEEGERYAFRLSEMLLSNKLSRGPSMFCTSVLSVTDNVSYKRDPVRSIG
jgi:hypothetical protein